MGEGGKGEKGGAREGGEKGEGGKVDRADIHVPVGQCTTEVNQGRHS